MPTKLVAVFALLCLCCCVSGGEVQTTTTSIGLGPGEANWLLIFILITGLSVLEHSSSVAKGDKWRDVARVFPSFQIWRGHFSPDDDLGPAEVCVDWKPYTMDPPYSEAQLHNCWQTMWQAVGDRTATIKDQRPLSNFNYPRLILFLLLGFLGMQVAVSNYNTAVVYAPVEFQPTTITSISKSCGALAATETNPEGAYENIDTQATQCTGSVFGSVCFMACAKGYVNSRHFGHYAICGLDNETSLDLKWLPAGNAYQNLCHPDILHSTRGLKFNLQSFKDKMWQDGTRNDYDALEEHCWDDGQTCSSVSEATLHTPVLGNSGWIDFSTVGSYRKSLRSNVPVFDSPSIAVFSIIRPTTASWSNIKQVHNLVQLDELSQLADGDIFSNASRMFTSSVSNQCDGKAMVYTLIAKSEGPTSGKLAIRINGMGTGGDGVIDLNLVQRANIWEQIAPLFTAETTVFDTSVAGRLLAGPESTFSSLTPTTPRLGGLTLTACVQLTDQTETHTLSVTNSGSDGSTCVAITINTAAKTVSLFGTSGSVLASLAYSSATVGDGLWHSFVVVVDGLSVSLFLDGSADGTATIASEANTHSFYTCGLSSATSISFSTTSSDAESELVKVKSVDLRTAAADAPTDFSCPASDSISNIVRSAASFSASTTSHNAVSSVPKSGISISFGLQRSSSQTSAGSLVKFVTGSSCGFEISTVVSVNNQISFVYGSSLSTVFTLDSSIDLNDGQWHALVLVISIEDSSITLSVDGKASTNSGSLSTSAVPPTSCASGTTYVGYDGSTELTGKLKNVVVYQYALSPTEASTLESQTTETGKIPLTFGHGGGVPPTMPFDTTTSFEGEMAQIVAYNTYLDPTTDDEWNLRRIEAIEWHLATRWGISQSMAPAKPAAPKHESSDCTTPTAHCVVILSLIPQGGGYSDSFEQRLEVSTSSNFPEASTVYVNLVPLQKSVRAVGTKGGWAYFRVSARLQGFPDCLSAHAGGSEFVPGDFSSVYLA